MLWAGELVLRGGRALGQLTSAAWGETLGASVGLAYLRHPGGTPVTADFARAGSYQVDIGGQRCPAAVHLRPPLDPAGQRLQKDRPRP